MSVHFCFKFIAACSSGRILCAVPRCPQGMLGACMSASASSKTSKHKLGVIAGVKSHRVQKMTAKAAKP